MKMAQQVGADITKEEWYSYDGNENHWANAQTQEGSMWVWIPRYAYKINGDKSIDVVFLKDNTDIYEQDGVEKNALEQGYIVHPCFEDGSKTGYLNGEWDRKINGFWIAKFEAGYVSKDIAIDSNISYSTVYGRNPSENVNLSINYYGAINEGTKLKYPTFSPNKPSVNYIGISDAYDLCKDITSINNPYKLKNIDSHLTKNSELGAVVYLTQSKYGRNKEEVTINNVTLNGVNDVFAVTGYAGANINAQPNVITIDEMNTNSVKNSYEWTTIQGQKASSTNNVYGIYDLNGGAWEWTSGYIGAGTYYTTYAKSLEGDSNKYKSKYAGTSENDQTNYTSTPNTTRVGEAIWETSTKGTEINSWNGDYSYFLSTTQGPFTIRAGGWYNAQVAGTFGFTRNYGFCNYFLGFRTVLVNI